MLFSHEIEMAIMTVAAGVVQFAANWLIQSTLLIGIGLILAKCLHSRGSAFQSLVYRTTLVAVLICPLATWGLSQAGVSGWSVSIPPGFVYEKVTPAPVNVAAESTQTPSPAVVEPELISDFTTPTAAAAEPTLPGPAIETQLPIAPPFETAAAEATVAVPIATPNPQTFKTYGELWNYNISWFGLLSPLVLVAWLTVSGLLIARLARSWWRMSRLIQTADVADQPTSELSSQVASQLGVKPPGVLRSPFIPSPCLAGLGIVQPAKILLPADELHLPMRDVLVHEIAHLRRHDCHWNLLRQIATAVYFFQPLLWILSRQIEIAAEDVCDDTVVDFGGDRLGYAHRLVDIAELSSDVSAAAVAAAGVGIVSLRSMLARRVERILDTSRNLESLEQRSSVWSD